MSKYGISEETILSSPWKITNKWCKGENNKPIVFNTYEEATAEAQRIGDSKENANIHRFYNYYPQEFSQEELRQFGIEDTTKNSIRILVVEVMKAPYATTIENNFKAMQKIVGGEISYSPFSTLSEAIYVNAHGATNELDVCRKLEQRNAIYGDFLICGKDSNGNNISLSDVQIRQYSEKFQLEKAKDAVQDGSIRILVVEPHKKPYVLSLENDFEAMQKVVGGDIEFVPLPDSDCHIYCNDEGKLDGLPGNRRMDNDDIICGTFIICSDDGEGCDTSLNDEQIGRYMERFGEPEQHSDDEAHQFAYEIKGASSAVDFLRMLGLVECENDLEDEFEQ